MGNSRVAFDLFTTTAGQLLATDHPMGVLWRTLIDKPGLSTREIIALAYGDDPEALDRLRYHCGALLAAGWTEVDGFSRRTGKLVPTYRARTERDTTKMRKDLALQRGLHSLSNRVHYARGRLEEISKHIRAELDGGGFNLWGELERTEMELLAVRDYLTMRRRKDPS